MWSFQTEGLQYRTGFSRGLVINEGVQIYVYENENPR
nr:MAG TPA: hypothetical protein [Caudoviricetes sp.]